MDYENYDAASSVKYNNLVHSFKLPAYTRNISRGPLDSRYFVFPKETLQTVGLLYDNSLIRTHVDLDNTNANLETGLNIYPSGGVLFQNFDATSVVEGMKREKRMELEAIHNFNLSLQRDIDRLNNEAFTYNTMATNYNNITSIINNNTSSLNTAINDYATKSKNICGKTNVNQYIISDHHKGKESDYNDAVCLSDDFRAVTCDNTVNHTWSYNFNSKNLTSRKGCAASSGNQIITQPCNENQKSQKWEYTNKQFKNSENNCITPINNRRSILTGCKNDNTQKFTFNPVRPDDRMPGGIDGMPGIFDKKCNNITNVDAKNIIQCHQKATANSSVNAWTYDENAPQRCKHYTSFKYYVIPNSQTSGANTSSKTAKTYCKNAGEKVKSGCKTTSDVPSNIHIECFESHPNRSDIESCRQNAVEGNKNEIAYLYDNGNCANYDYHDMYTKPDVVRKIIASSKNGECAYTGDNTGNRPIFNCFEQPTVLLFPQPNYEGNPVWYINTNNRVVNTSVMKNFTMNLQQYNNQEFKSVYIPEGYYIEYFFKDNVGVDQKVILNKNTPSVYGKGVTSITLLQNTGGIQPSLFVQCYQHNDYGGILNMYPLGIYDNVGIFDNKDPNNNGLSSMKIPQGLYVTLYDAKTSTSSTTYTGDVPELGSSGWNNTATRINISNVPPDLCALKGLVAGFLLRRSVEVPPSISWNISNSASKTTKPMALDFHFATSKTLGVSEVNNFILENKNYLSYEYTGYIVPTTTGNYQFGLQSDDASDIALYLNNTWTIVSSAYGIKPTEGDKQAHYSAQNLIASQCYPIRIRFHEHEGDRALIVSWKLNNGDWSDIPFSVFRLPTKVNFPNPAHPIIATFTTDNNCVDVYGGGHHDGAKIISWPCHGGNNQKWHVEPAGDNYFTLKARHSNKCLDVYAHNYSSGVNVVQWDCNGGTNQKWYFKDNKIASANTGSDMCLTNNAQNNIVLEKCDSAKGFTYASA